MLAGRTGLCPVMVGRGMELARLHAALATDGTQVVMVSGEAGVGKTRLLRELAATLPAGARVLAGQASQGVPGRPFQLLLEAIGPSVAAWRHVPRRLAQREEPLRLLLRPILTHLEPCSDREYGQEELLGAAVALVEDLLIGAGRGVLVFEDLHWADAQSVALFGRLALTPGLGALVVGSFRPEAVDRRHPLVATLAEVGRQREVTQVALDRLDREEGIALLERAVAEAEAGTGTVAGATMAGRRTMLLRADCQLGAARCLEALGRCELAKAHALVAEELLERWPGWRRDEVRALLVRLRAEPRRATGPLTPREREVAALVAGRLSNGEVAKRLFISTKTKTASVHVSNILSKLGMSSRVEIAAWAVGTGLATVGQGQH